MYLSNNAWHNVDGRLIGFVLVLTIKEVHFMVSKRHTFSWQECIPVGCVPPAGVAVCWGGCLPQCMLGYTPGPGPGEPPPLGCGPGDPPHPPRPHNFPLARPLPQLPSRRSWVGLGLETPPPARPLNPPWGVGPPPPPPEQNSWHTLLKILPCPNFVAGSKKFTWENNTCAWWNVN